MWKASRLLLLACWIMSGCASTTPPPQVPFPSPPADLMQPPEPLLQPQEPVDLAQTLKTITKNYAASLRTATRLEALQNWVWKQYRLTQ